MCHRVRLQLFLDYHVETIPFSRSEREQDESPTQVYHTDWQMMIYTYATNASPIGKTSKDYEGTIYTYIVHEGVHARAASSPGRNYGPPPSIPG